MVTTYLLSRITATDTCHYEFDAWSRFFAYRPQGGVYPQPGARQRPVQGQTPDDVAAAMRRAYPEARLALPPDGGARA